MKNVKELQDKMVELYSQVESDTINPKKAKALADIAGKIISASAVQVKYYSMLKQRPRIGFLSTRGNSDEQV